MIVLIVPKVSMPVNWWFKPIGCEIKEPTREQLLDWHIRKPRKITEGVNPLVIAGLVEVGAAIGLQFLFDSKNIKLVSIFLGVKGVILKILGGIHVYDLLSEARSKRLREEETPQIQTKPEKQARSSELSGEAIEKIIEGGEAVQNPADDQTPIKKSLKELQLLEERFDIKKILNIVRKILNKCSKQQYKNIAEETYLQIVEIGRNLQVKVLEKAMEDKDIMLKRWAMLCLITKETEDAERVLVNSIKTPVNLAILSSFTTNENLELLVARITQIVKKAAA